MTTLTVVRVGPGTSVQDLGRPGFSDVGLGASGAADRGSAALAGRMVGNRPDAAVLEALLGSVSLRADGYVVAALTGAVGPVRIERADGRVRGAAVFEVITLRPGDTLHVDTATIGLRTYLAVRGGFAVEPVLGSRSWDSLAELGPPPVVIGDVLPVGDAADSWPVIDAVVPRFGPGAGPVAGTSGAASLDLVAGPRDDWFDPGWRAVLTGQVHHVTPDSDRIGVRTVAPQPLVRAVHHELPSEGVETGSLQVPPEGHPVLFLADHPVTGGYPVVGVLTPASVDRAAQLRPGDAVRFRIVR